MDGVGRADQLELEVLDWFKDWIGYPAQAGGALVAGGSIANLTALACARESLAGAMSEDVVGYVGDQAHSSLGRGARVLGFRPDQLRVLPSTRDLRLDPRAVAAAMDADLMAGRRPLFVSANAGATNTGAIDPLPELAQLCRDRDVWFHVDAAYGGFAVLTERGRELLRGMELADSVTLDPHKWLHQPYECGCLLVRDDRRLRAAFQMTPDYLQDAEALEEVNLSDRGIQLTRSSRAIKVWVSQQFFGTAAFRTAIDCTLDLAEFVHERVMASEVLELTAPPSLGVVCFRRRFPHTPDDDEQDRLNAGLVAALERSGLGLISSTVLRGRYSLRTCVLAHTTERSHLEAVLDFLEHAEPAPSGESSPVYERDRQMQFTPIRRRVGDEAEVGAPAAALAGAPLFATLAESERERVAAVARMSERGPGQPIVSQWEATFDFYVILEGRVQVFVDDVAIDVLGPGEFFGELAAIDWGSGFGYPRTGSVVALERTTMVSFTAGAMNELLRDQPAIGRQIRRLAAERLRRTSS